MYYIKDTNQLHINCICMSIVIQAMHKHQTAEESLGGWRTGSLCQKAWHNVSGEHAACTQRRNSKVNTRRGCRRAQTKISALAMLGHALRYCSVSWRHSDRRLVRNKYERLPSRPDTPKQMLGAVGGPTRKLN